MVTERRYLFAPLEQRGVIAGLRAGQVGSLAAGLLCAIGIVRATTSAFGLIGALAVLGAALAMAFVQVGGRPGEQWAPVVGRHVGLHLAGGHRRRAGPGGLTKPRPLANLVISEHARGPGLAPMAVVVDRSAGTLGAVIGACGRSFALLEADEKERRLSAWGDLLASLARDGGPVLSLQWIERTAGGDGEALARHLSARLAIEADAPPTRSYSALVAEAGPLTQEHDCYIVLTVRRGKGHAVLAREIRLLEGQLRNADIDVTGVLGVRELGGVIRTAYDPAARMALARRAATQPELAGSVTGAAWPSATETTWASYRTDDCWHATYWVAEWPRTEVGPDFLGPLMLHASTQRSVALIMAPASPSEGYREAEAARTAIAADEELRRRAGFLSTARRRRDAEGLARREAELSDGHASYRFSGYVTVSARGPDSLDEACAEIVQLGHQCRLDLRRLHGLQDVAFTWTLPLGRGMA